MYDRVKNAKQFLENKKILTNRYATERSGNIQTFRDQEKLLAPLIKSQEETSKATQEKIVANLDLTSNILVPLMEEIKKRNDQVDILQQLPYYQAQLDQPAPIAEFTPKKKPTTMIDFDQELNTTDRENLEYMKLELPSIVFNTDTNEEVKQRIKTENRSIGQFLGQGAAGKKLDSRQKAFIESKKATLVKYLKILEDIEPGKRFIIKQKTGKGIKNTNVVYYNSPDELCEKLRLRDASKQAGNTGVNNDINAILDELLKIGHIDKETFNKLYKNIFV